MSSDGSRPRIVENMLRRIRTRSDDHSALARTARTAMSRRSDEDPSDSASEHAERIALMTGESGATSFAVSLDTSFCQVDLTRRVTSMADATISDFTGARDWREACAARRAPREVRRETLAAPPHQMVYVCGYFAAFIVVLLGISSRVIALSRSHLFTVATVDGPTASK